MNVKKTRYHSYCVGGLAKGCQLCVEGRKLVLYITGICSNSCYYCPLSDKRRGKDKIWANERPIEKVSEAIEEAELCSATGAGITGGDPLMRLERTVEYIKALKKRFGKEFHIHLYTSLKEVTEDKLRKLYEAGLDEIRFHPDVEKKEWWPRLKLAKKFSWQAGIEIPVIPDKEAETEALMEYAKDKIDFLNLNELEISDNNANKLTERGYRTKDSSSYAILDSEKAAKKLLRHAASIGMKTHFCTAKLKDRVQLFERIRRRASNIVLKTDRITKDATIRRGVLYPEALKPGFGYNKRMEEMPKAEKAPYIKKLKSLKKYIVKQYGISPEELTVDTRKLRILTSTAIADQHKQEFRKVGLIAAIVEEYPTWDQLEIEVNFL